MRDGNKKPAGRKKRYSAVVSLPMRDGNTRLYPEAEEGTELLAYL